MIGMARPSCPHEADKNKFKSNFTMFFSCLLPAKRASHGGLITMFRSVSTDETHFMAHIIYSRTPATPTTLKWWSNFHSTLSINITTTNKTKTLCLPNQWRQHLWRLLGLMKICTHVYSEKDCNAASSSSNCYLVFLASICIKLVADSVQARSPELWSFRPGALLFCYQVLRGQRTLKKRERETWYKPEILPKNHTPTVWFQFRFGWLSSLIVELFMCQGSPVIVAHINRLGSISLLLLFMTSTSRRVQ